MTCAHCELPAAGSHGLCGRHLSRRNRYGDPLVTGIAMRATVHEVPKVPRLAKYGLTREDFDLLWKACEGRCAICRDELDETTCNVDHDHVTGEVRGLLCRPCNQGLGMFADDAARLAAAIAYLLRSSG